MDATKQRRVSRRRVPRGENRQRIIDAAMEVFGEQGLAGARTRDIARRAGVQQSLITYYFGGKDELWQACAAAIYREAAERVSAADRQSRGLDARARLKLLLQEYVQSASNRPHGRLFTMRARSAGAPAPSASTKADWENVRAIELRIVRELQAEGALPPGDPLMVLGVLIGTAIGFFDRQWERDMAERLDQQELLKRLLGVINAMLKLD